MSGRVVLVTGGAKGLGRGIATAFAARGDKVLTCGRSEPIEESGPGYVQCDVRDPDAVEDMVATLVSDHGSIDVVINNAGGTPYAAAATMSPRLFEKVVALNLLAAFYVSQAANRRMQDQDSGGVIVNIGSTSAIRPAYNAAPYVAAKAGLVGLTRCLAMEWAPKVRVNQVTVGLLRTEMVHETYGEDVAAVESTVPMGRFVSPEEVGAACVMLASPEASMICGADLVVDGGGEEPAWARAVVRRN